MVRIKKPTDFVKAVSFVSQMILLLMIYYVSNGTLDTINPYDPIKFYVLIMFILNMMHQSIGYSVANLITSLLTWYIVVAVSLSSFWLSLIAFIVLIFSSAMFLLALGKFEIDGKNIFVDENGKSLFK